MIIDTHTHFYDPARPEGVPWPPKDNELLYRTVLPQAYKDVAIPEGITGTVVVEASNRLEDNQWILDLADQEPFVVGFVGHVEPGDDAFARHLTRFAADPRFCGIRCGAGYFLEPPTARFLTDVQNLAERGLVLDVLVRLAQLDNVIAVAKALPSLRIVVNHIAHMPIDGGSVARNWQDAYRRLAAEPEIRMKVSALPEQCTVQPAPSTTEVYHPTLDVLWATFGEDRLIYGSNWPVCERAGTFEIGINACKAYLEDKGDAAYEKFFHQNAANAYRWPNAL
mgnify:CR=1 FL=1